MTLPYENTTAGDKALGEIQKMLRAFGCSKFGSMVDDEEGSLLVQFEYRGKPVSVKASTKGYAAAWLRENPYTSRMRCTKLEHERKVTRPPARALTRRKSMTTENIEEGTFGGSELTVGLGEERPKATHSAGVRFVGKDGVMRVMTMVRYADGTTQYGVDTFWDGDDKLPATTALRLSRESYEATVSLFIQFSTDMGRFAITDYEAPNDQAQRREVRASD